jgi:hypothetical protein
MDHIVDAIVELIGSGRGRDVVSRELQESLAQNEGQLRMMRAVQMPSDDDLKTIQRLGRNVALYKDAISTFDEGGMGMDASLKAKEEELEKLTVNDLLELIDDKSGGGLRKKRKSRRKKKRTKRRKSKKRKSRRKSRKHK